MQCTYTQKETKRKRECQRESERANKSCVYHDGFPGNISKWSSSVFYLSFRRIASTRPVDMGVISVVHLIIRFVFSLFFPLSAAPSSSHSTMETFDLATNPIMSHLYAIIVFEINFIGCFIECARSSESGHRRTRIHKGWICGKNRIAKCQTSSMYERANWNICFISLLGVSVCVLCYVFCCCFCCCYPYSLHYSIVNPSISW